MEETLGILKLRSPHSAGFHLYIIGQRRDATIPRMICSLWVGHQLEGWQEHSIWRFKTPFRIDFWSAQGSSRLDLPGGVGDRVIEREREQIKRLTNKAKILTKVGGWQKLSADGQLSGTYCFFTIERKWHISCFQVVRSPEPSLPLENAYNGVGRQILTME